MTSPDLAIPLPDAAPSEDLSGHKAPEDWIVLLLFWALCIVVFLQFFTRYVLNNSFGWTEEVARYFLIGVVFTGAAMCMRRHRHVQVNFLYRLLPQRLGFVLARIVDAGVICFFGYATWLTWSLMQIIGEERMTLINLPMNTVYVFVLGGLAVACLRAVQVAAQNWRQGYGALERPDLYMDDN